MSAKTLYEKLVESHTIRELDNEGHVLLYIDRSILNEYTSPQAFSGLRERGRTVRHPDTFLLNIDHVNPTRSQRDILMTDPGGQLQVDYFRENAADFGITLFDVLDPRQGIEHVVAHEQGLVMPGMVIAAGDSHTTTYGAFGALGFGIGTSEIEHLLATQTLVYRKLKTMRVSVQGELPFACSAKDIVLELLERIGADGATGYAIEFVGEAISALSVEGRMTLCNMAVEAGARGAIIAPDQTGSITGRVPFPEQETNPLKRLALEKALHYMGLTAGMLLKDIRISHAFIGSCTNGRIEDLRAVAKVLEGRKIASHVRGIIVPGSTMVRRQAEEEGLAKIFIAAGFEWRQSGCSMCLAMNEDVLSPGDRCASGTNRNFPGRQGAGARTHLMSPAMVAAAAVEGHLVDVRPLLQAGE